MESICNLCHTDVRSPELPEPVRDRLIDGKTLSGSWAYMCVPCHSAYGVGLGTGRGQLFDVATGKKLEG